MAKESGGTGDLLRKDGSMAKDSGGTKQTVITKPSKPVNRPIPAPVNTRSCDKNGVVYR